MYIYIYIYIYIYKTKSSYHEQRPGIPSACHLQPNYHAEM